MGSLLDVWRDYRGAFVVSPLPLTVADPALDGGWSTAACGTSSPMWRLRWLNSTSMVCARARSGGPTSAWTTRARDPEILPGSADGYEGAPIQLVTMVEGVARVWNLATETWYDLACVAAGRNLNAEEWELLGPRKVGYTVTCAQWPGKESAFTSAIAIDP